MTITRLPFILLFCLMTNVVFGQSNDVTGSKDHPSISRFDGFRIGDYEEVNFDKYTIPLGPGTKGAFNETKVVEGKVTKIFYAMNEDGRPSLYELVSNYEKTLSAAPGAELIYSCDQAECGRSTDEVVTMAAINGVTLSGFMRFGTHAFRVYRYSFEGKQYHLAIYFREEKNLMQYEMHFIESDELKTDKVTVADLKENLNNTGKQAFYGIYFDFGKATLKPESADELAIMATFVRENPDLYAFVVGHTDVIGEYDKNISLSEARAKAVIEALKTDHNVDTKTLRPIGVGPVSPVATNRTEEGRAKNRRVELVLWKLGE
ncbi:MAG: OmpA family protein [Bacteroidota bacterium]